MELGKKKNDGSCKPLADIECPTYLLEFDGIEGLRHAYEHVVNIYLEILFMHAK